LTPVGGTAAAGARRAFTPAILNLAGWLRPGRGRAGAKKSQKTANFFVAFRRETVNKEAWQQKQKQNANPAQRS